MCFLLDLLINMGLSNLCSTEDLRFWELKVGSYSLMVSKFAPDGWLRGLGRLPA